MGTNRDVPLVIFSEWSNGNADRTRFVNNIFHVDGRVSYDLGGSRGTSFENNLYFGSHAGRPVDARGVTNRPPLASPGTAGNGFDSARGYLLTHMPEFMRGQAVADDGGRDFLGRAIPADAIPFIGCGYLAD